jgi:hypothetical protein
VVALALEELQRELSTDQRQQLLSKLLEEMHRGDETVGSLPAGD